MKHKFYFLLIMLTFSNVQYMLGQTSTKFNDGYLTVYKATSTSTLTNTGTAIAAEEYNPTSSSQSAPNYSITLPTASGNKLVVSGTATASGGITRSENGRYLLIPGYNGLVGDANTTFTTNATIRTINASGNVGSGISGGGTTLWLSGNNNLRGATSDDGTNYWFTGNGVGIQTSTNGTALTTVSSTTTNNRDVSIQNGQLYLTTGAGTQGIYSVGSGKPITTGQTGTRVFAPANTDVYAFSISPDGKTVYYVAATGGGIYRSTFDGAAWTTGTKIYNVSGFTGLVVDWSNYSFNTSSPNGARMYACNPSTIIAADDNGTTAVNNIVLRNEPTTANNAFRQLAFSPCKQTISLGANSPANGNISATANNVVLFQFNLNADEGNSTLKKVILHQTGTATIGSGNDITNFRLIEDSNNNGIAEASELASVLSTGTISSSDIIFGSITLSSYMNEGFGKNFIVVGDVSATAIVGNTFIPSIVSNKTLNGINYTTNLFNAGGSWINIGTAAPSGNTLTIAPCQSVSIISQPISPLSFCEGSGIAMFIVKVSGTAPYSYQWQENSVNINSTAVYSGTNSDTLKITNPNYSLNGKTYQCIISNCSGGSIITTDNTSALTVNPLPAKPLVFTDSSATVNAGQTSVTYTIPNDPTVSYNWNYSGTGATINGAGNSVSLDFLVSATSGTLSVTATNGCGTSSARNISVTVIPVPGAVRITEYMYNGGGSGSVGEFVEFTNVGGTPVSMTGWSFDDNSRLPGSQSLSAFGTVQPGESVVLTEIPAYTFRTNWNLCPSVKIIGGNTNNLGREDEINLYDATNTLVDRLTYGDQTYSPGSIRTTLKSGWVNTTGLGTNTITNWTLSSIADAETSFASTLGEIGSPGKSSRAIIPFDPCLIVNGTPTIIMNVNATTNYLDGAQTVAPTSPYGISGVINDPTDPAQTLGIDFIINDAETAVGSLTVTASSSNTSVVPNANISLTGGGASRNVKITPIAVGYTDITVTVNDGSYNASFVINYAASVASTTPASTFWHTGMSDASDAIAIDSNYFMSGDDELNVLNVYSRAASGLPLVSYDYTSNLALPDPGNPEVDLEAATNSTANANMTYWLGSMSNGKSPFPDKPNRNRIFATSHNGTGASTTFSFVGYYGNLRGELISWGDANGYNFTASAAAGVDSKSVSGFAAEGMVFGPDNTTLYIGLRAPLVPTSNRTKAVIAPIQNFETWFNNGTPSGNPTFGSPIELDLGGRGFRDLIRLSNGTYVIIAGNPSGSPLTSAIYKWTGNTADAPVLITTSADGILNMEGAMQINSGGNLSLSKLQVISDGGDEILYADGNEAKSFTDLNLRKFRSDRLSAIDLCITKTADTTAIACNSFIWYSNTYTSSLSPTHTFTTSEGCDSIVTLHLTIKHSTTADTTAIACNSFNWHGTNYTNSGTATHLFTNATGCDSVVTLHLTINHSTAGDTTAIACNNFNWHGTSYTNSGTATHLFTNAAGCDSVVTLHLTINQSPSPIITPNGSTTFCDGDSVILSSTTASLYQWLLNGNSISGATNSTYVVLNQGNYSVFVSVGTCSATSPITVVTVNSLPSIPVISQNGTLLTSTPATTYQWYLNGISIPSATNSSYAATSDGSYYVVISNSNGCESSSTPVIVNTTDINVAQEINVVNTYPNPFKDITTVQITVEKKSHVTADVYSILGEHLQTIVDSELTAGNYNFNFSAKQLSYSSGIYIMKVIINGKMYITRMVQNE